MSGDGIEVDDCVDELLGESFAPEPLDPLGSHNDTDIQSIVLNPHWPQR